MELAESFQKSSSLSTSSVLEATIDPTPTNQLFEFDLEYNLRY